MISFENDYSEGAHPRILRMLEETGHLQHTGYGLDPACEGASALLRSLMAAPEAEIHYLMGGTSANLIAMAAFLRPHEAVISARTGHVNVHETGAIEATGHKVFAVSAPEGKLAPKQVKAVLAEHQGEHMVKPRLVYVSNATELGTHYGLQELRALRACCDAHGLLLFLDGARLGNALVASDVDLADLAVLCDAFYIGGTKNGALFGEAMVLVNPALRADFRYILKQRGGMLAKGFLLGLQFQALFSDGLYFDNARHANAMAQALRKGLGEMGFPLLVQTETNMVFPILPNALLRVLRPRYRFHDQGAMPGEASAIRLVTSWATRIEAVEMFLQDVRKYM